MYDESYSLSLITKWAQIHNFSYKHSSAKVGCSFVEHGIRLELPGKFKLSIQTHPVIACSAFAESGLIYDNNLVYAYDILEYDDCQRFATPEELFAHIVAMNDMLLEHEEVDSRTVKLKTGDIVKVT